jgi:hypothetical protein
MPACFPSTARLCVATALALSALLAPSPASAQQTTHDHGAAPAAQTTPASEADAAADARLNRLVEAMNAAKGEARFPAMAAVIAELAAQRSDLRKAVQSAAAAPAQNSGAMNMGMMNHMMGMMQHMQGMMGMMGMMGGCSMMQGDHGAAK